MAPKTPTYHDWITAETFWTTFRTWSLSKKLKEEGRLWMTVLAKGRGGTRARRAYLQLARASFYIGTIRRKAARQGEYPPKDIECLVFEEMAQAMTEIELNTGYIFPLEESEMMEEKL